MTDIVSVEKRSEMMSGIRGKDSKPELAVRRLLFASGYRYRLHKKDLPGKPDIVLPRWRTVIFVHGCFWHGHENCHLYRLPKSRTDFWRAKIDSNRNRDAINIEKLASSGWKVIVIWECAIRGNAKISDWLERLEVCIRADGSQLYEIRGKGENP